VTRKPKWWPGIESSETVEEKEKEKKVRRMGGYLMKLKRRETGATSRAINIHILLYKRAGVCLSAVTFCVEW